MMQQLAVVGLQSARHLHARLLAAAHECPVARIAQQQAVVRRQIGWPARGAMPLQIARGGDQDQPIRCQPLGDQRAVGQRAGADGGIVAVLLQINDAVGDVDAHLDLRVGVDEADQRRRHHTARQDRRRRDLQPARRPLRAGPDRRPGLLDLGQDAFGILEELEAFLGDPDRAGGPVEQPRLEVVLERLQALRDRPGRQAEFGAHRRQVLQRRDTGEDTQILDVHTHEPERGRSFCTATPDWGW